jgi:hypothetical protein
LVKRLSLSRLFETAVKGAIITLKIVALKKFTGLVPVFFLLMALIFLIPGCACAESLKRFDIHGAGLSFSQTGQLTAVTREGRTFTMEGLYTDVGVDGAFLYSTVGYQRFWDMATWDLAKIVPISRQPAEGKLLDIQADDDGVTVTIGIQDMILSQRYTVMKTAIACDVTVTSNKSTVCEIQGVNFLLRNIRVSEDATFEFPGNVPYGVTRLNDLRAFATKQTAYCNPVVLARDKQTGFNAVFLNEEEKWSTAVYHDKAGGMYIANLSMTELLLHPGEGFQVGTLYLQMTGEDPFAPLQALYDEKGYAPASSLDGAATGPMYSCHPAGTMDSGFRDTKTMRSFAESLPALSKMGIENIWVLPIFEHTGRGVYSPTDQSVIDKRYGTDADVACFVDTAHSLGMKVLFDYVPHGPEPQDPLAANHPEWCSISRQGGQQIEWDCVSFDMANKDYQAYTRQLVMDHVERFHVDGGRIDCAMGGLSNWQPQKGNRPSSSSLKGGMGIVSAIREGFLLSGVTPTLLPENFHPLPFYASVTDIFYDMPMYRMMFDMRESGVDEVTFATELTRWLYSENLASVKGQKKLRFLGNHDTVSWTWDQARATNVYGEEKAKALWVLMSTIDGIPFLYQGDEDSSLYHFKGGYDLTGFFTELFAARKKYLRDDMQTEYYLNDLGVAVYTRTDEESRQLVLTNLCGEEKTIPLSGLPELSGTVLYGSADISTEDITLPPYGYVMLACEN